MKTDRIAQGNPLNALVTQMGRKSKKRGDTCVSIADSPCCTAETNTTL